MHRLKGLMFRLTCVEWNDAHVKFSLFDPLGANCGFIVVRTEDVITFIRDNWNGLVYWDGHIPADFNDSLLSK